MLNREKLPDCQDQMTGDFSSRIRQMAEDRANAACGDNRKGKGMNVHGAMIDLIHHEAMSGYLAGYLQASKDFMSTDEQPEEAPRYTVRMLGTFVTDLDIDGVCHVVRDSLQSGLIPVIEIDLPEEK